MNSLVPYTFLATFKDKGCPSKSWVKIYSIFVVKKAFVGTDEIEGEELICMDQLAEYYFTDTSSSYDYKWSILNGGGSIIGSED